MKHWTQSPHLKEIPPAPTDQENWDKFIIGYDRAISNFCPDKINKQISKSCRQMESIIDDLHEEIESYMSYQLAKCIEDNMPSDTTNQEKYNILLQIIKAFRKNIIKPYKIKQETSIYFGTPELEIDNEREEFKNSIIYSKFQIPFKLQQSILQLIDTLTVSILSATLTIESFPDEIIKWENLDLKPKNLNQKLKTLTYKESQIREITKYVHTSALNSHNSYFKIIKDLETLRKDSYEIELFTSMHLIKTAKSLIEQIKTFKNTPAERISNIFKSRATSLNDLRWFIKSPTVVYLWVTYQFETNISEFKKNKLRLIKELKNNPKRLTITWGKSQFPTLHLNTQYLLSLANESENEVLNTAALLAGIINDDTFQDYINISKKNESCLKPIQKFLNILIEDQNLVIPNIGFNDNPYIIKSLEEFEDKEYKKLVKKTQRDTEKQNQELLEEWKLEEPSEPIIEVQEEIKETPVTIHYCPQKELKSSKYFSLDPSSDPHKNKQWKKFLRNVKCPNIDTTSLWNAILYLNSMNTSTLALTPYDNAKGVKWKKIKRGAFRIFLHKVENSYYLHVIDRKNWSFQD
jgi:hypothetical protein